MKFIDNIDEKRYVEFESIHEKAHFMQSYEWGQFAIKGKNLVPIYVGLEDEMHKLLCVALLLKKEIPFGYSYIYCPRGYVIDFNDTNLLEIFTNELKAYMKKNKIIYIKIDPDIIYQDIDEMGLPISEGNNNYKIYDTLISLGYKHKGFNKLYEKNQPRYTFRIDLTKSKEEIDSMMNKSFLKSVKRSYNYFMDINNKIDIDTFYELNIFNCEKDNFMPYKKLYYEEFTKYFAKYDHVKYYNAVLNIPKVIKNIDFEKRELEEKLKIDKKHQVDINNQINRLLKDRETFNSYNEDNVTVCSLICVYAGSKSWSLFIGSNDLANYTFAVSRCYYDSIMDAKDNGYKIYDLFGTVGDPNTKYKNLAHLHDFKRKFGDQYTEFIGEFDLINCKLLYNILPILLKVYRKIRKL